MQRIFTLSHVTLISVPLVQAGKLLWQPVRLVVTVMFPVITSRDLTDITWLWQQQPQKRRWGSVSLMNMSAGWPASWPGHAWLRRCCIGLIRCFQSVCCAWTPVGKVEATPFDFQMRVTEPNLEAAYRVSVFEPGEKGRLKEETGM